MDFLVSKGVFMRTISLVLISVLSLCAEKVTAGTLITVPITFRNFFHRGTPMGAYKDDIVFSMGLRATPPVGENPPLTPIANEIFNGVRFKNTEVGRTATLTAADDPDFSGFVAMLTNGIADELLVSTTTFADGGFAGAPEATSQAVSARSERTLSILGSLDLQGYQIDSITERLDSLTITDNVVPIPSAPNIVGRQFDGQMTLSIEGSATPEPGTAGLFALATLGWAMRRRTH
jgi:hypothetical protein